jgi:hypothetical protein
VIDALCPRFDHQRLGRHHGAARGRAPKSRGEIRGVGDRRWPSRPSVKASPDPGLNDIVSLARDTARALASSKLAEGPILLDAHGSPSADCNSWQDSTTNLSGQG